jgi:hypothetical protein
MNMIKLWAAFAILAVLIHFGISAWRKMDGKEQLALTRSIGYSILVSLATVMLMTVLVILF